MTTIGKIKELEETRAKVARLEQAIEAELNSELAALPAKLRESWGAIYSLTDYAPPPACGGLLSHAWFQAWAQIRQGSDTAGSTAGLVFGSGKIANHPTL